MARPPSRLYRFQKLVRRNKLAFTAAAAVLMALLVGLGIAAVGWRQTRVERDNAFKARTGQASERRRSRGSQGNPAAPAGAGAGTRRPPPSLRLGHESGTTGARSGNNVGARGPCWTGSARSPARRICAAGSGVISGSNARMIMSLNYHSNPARSMPRAFPGWKAAGHCQRFKADEAVGFHPTRGNSNPQTAGRDANGTDLFNLRKILAVSSARDENNHFVTLINVETGQTIMDMPHTSTSIRRVHC